MAITKLPSELQIDILSLLTFRQILRCQLVSRLFNEIVRTSIRLQYIIELGVCGFVDLAISSMNTEDRLKLLKIQRTTWQQTSELQKVKTILLPESRTRFIVFRGNWMVRIFKAWDASGGFLAHLKVGVTDLTSKTPTELSWTCNIDVLPHRFAMDPVQDLIILTDASALSGCLNFSVLSLHDGTPHPLASSSPIRMNLDDRASYLGCTVLHVLDNLLVLKMAIYTSGRDTAQIIIMDWMRGSVQARLSFPGDTVLGICLVSSYYFIIGRCIDDDIRRTISLETYHLLNPSTTQHTLSSQAAILMARYQLPRLQEKPYTLLTLQSTALWNSTRAPTHSTPFTLHPMSGLIYVTLVLGTSPESKKYCIFVPLSTFFPHGIDRPIPHIYTPQPPTILWKDWGPRSTRWFPQVHLMFLTPKVYAYRAIFAQGLRDFNPIEISRDLQYQERRPSHIPSKTRSSTIVTEATVIPADRVFEHDVTSALPYRETSLSKPLTPDTGISSYDHLINLDMGGTLHPRVINLLAPLPPV